MAVLDLLHGDCRTVMAGLPAASVDAVVCDPPYGLSFMGKDWDHGVPGVAFWSAALRVAKPGAHLLAFGGTRTFHRLAVAIEDAGWEIRDTVMYVYGSGFPKSLNIGCKCGKDTVPYTHGGTQPKSQRDVRSVREADVSAAMDTSEGRREVLQPRLSEQGASITGRAEPSTAKVWSGQLGMEGRGNVLAEARQLQADQVREMPAEVFADGATGRLHHGTPPANGVASRAHANENRSSSPQEPRSARQHNRKLGTVRKQQRAQEGGVAEDQVCEICGGLKQWDGWGTALKPAQEIIVVARKSSDDTVRDTIATNLLGNLLQLEARLWLLLNASIVEKNLASNQTELSVVLNTAQWTAEKFISTQGDLFALMGTRLLEWVLITSLNTVSSWRSTWEEALKLGSMFITETVKSPITDLKILKSSLSEITPDFIIQAEIVQHGSWLHASPATMIFNAALSKLSATLAHSAIESAISRGHIPHPDAVDKAVLNLPIIVARKPLDGTVAQNVLKHGTGAINIDGCRVGSETISTHSRGTNGAFPKRPGETSAEESGRVQDQREGLDHSERQGRWPANLIHDGSDEVLALFPDTGKSTGGRIGKKVMSNVTNVPAGQYEAGDPGYGDSGSAARFFYCAKANKSDRDEGCEGMEETIAEAMTGRQTGSAGLLRVRDDGTIGENPYAGKSGKARNHHPTVKPTALMRYCCKMVTPPNGTVLDPFCGSGSTGKAAILEGFRFIGIEKDPEYFAIANARIEAALAVCHSELESEGAQLDMFK